MGGRCSMYGIHEKHTKFLMTNLKARDNLEDLGIDGRVILNRSLRNSV
jgi:hypothetical protein